MIIKIDLYDHSEIHEKVVEGRDISSGTVAIFGCRK
jgi:hypothetical protein